MRGRRSAYPGIQVGLKLANQANPSVNYSKKANRTEDGRRPARHGPQLSTDGSSGVYHWFIDEPNASRGRRGLHGQAFVASREQFLGPVKT